MMQRLPVYTEDVRNPYATQNDFELDNLARDKIRAEP